MTDINFIESKLDKLSTSVDIISKYPEADPRRNELIDKALEEERKLREYLPELPRRSGLRKKILNLSKRFNQYRHKYN